MTDSDSGSLHSSRCSTTVTVTVVWCTAGSSEMREGFTSWRRVYQDCWLELLVANTTAGAQRQQLAATGRQREKQTHKHLSVYVCVRNRKGREREREREKEKKERFPRTTKTSSMSWFDARRSDTLPDDIAVTLAAAMDACCSTSSNADSAGGSKKAAKKAEKERLKAEKVRSASRMN